MRNAELRRACVALIHNRVRAAAPAEDPVPSAIGWHLENSQVSAGAMSALCAATVAGVRTARWRPSAALRALLREYHEVRESRLAAVPDAPAAGPLDALA
jgi:hypothetical protein